MKNLDVTGGKPIVMWLKSILGESAVNPLVAFYDIHQRKGEVLFFCRTRCLFYFSRKTVHQKNYEYLEYYTYFFFICIKRYNIIQKQAINMTDNSKKRKISHVYESIWYYYMFMRTMSSMTVRWLSDSVLSVRLRRLSNFTYCRI
jgi:hypothetical protein